MSQVSVPGRVFISYAWDDDKHVGKVREFYHFLRACGIDADLDLVAAERAQHWATWMLRGIRDSRHVIVVASPAYKRRAEGDAGPGEGRGVQWEARLLQNLVYEDPGAALDRVVPVVLPGGSPDNLPVWLGGGSRSYYTVQEFTVAGAEPLLRLLTNQPYETEPPLGPALPLPPREATGTARPLVLPPPVVESSPVPAPQPPPPTFAFPEQKALLDALMGCPALHRLDSRHELLAEMGGWLLLGRPFDVPESPDARTHLRALVRRIARTTMTADAALKALYRALDEIAPDDTGTERVRELLVASGIVLGEA
jgi:hypothetical protein